MPKQKKPLPLQSLIYLALLIAAQIVLARILVLDLGAYRISFGTVASILAGLWFGPLGGGLCGFAADILGCFVKGYAINPFITLSAILWGVVPGLAGLWTAGKGRREKTIGICLSIVTCGVLCSLVLTTMGLVLLLGYHLAAILPGRLIQSCIMVPLYCLLTTLLYFSPLTALVRSSGQTS